MPGISYYKIGSRYYSIQPDKNGGKHEAYLIESAVEKVNEELVGKPICTGDADLFICVNGKKDEFDTAPVEKGRQTCKKMIFILTDYNFIQDNMEFIQMADEVWWQSPICHELLGKPARYSYVPELFYNEREPAEYRNNVCLFGGNIPGRTDEVVNMCTDGLGNFMHGMMCLYKDGKGTDTRVNYEKYQELLATCSCTYVSGRLAGLEVGWITPRYIEAIAAGCVPIKIGRYDSAKYFGFEELRATNKQELKKSILFAALKSDSEEMRKERDRFRQTKDCFGRMLKEEVRRLNNDLR